MPQPQQPAPSRAQRLLKRIMINCLLVFAGFFAIYAACVFAFQRRLIYFPNDYPVNYGAMLGQSRGVEIPFHTSAGRQTMFYIPPRVKPEEPPARLWVLFGGNASLALDWLDFVDSVPGEDVGFLLVDYPGYGNCVGLPTRGSILETTDAILPALADHLKVPAGTLSTNLNVLGHSLGAAVGLEFAVKHPSRQIVMLSPFTSLFAMARRQVGWPIMHLLRDRFDNRARLAELSQGDHPPKVSIFHGKADEIVPASMGQELAKSFPEIATYRGYDSCNHNWIIEASGKDLCALISPSRAAEESTPAQ